MEITEQSKM